MTSARLEMQTLPLATMPQIVMQTLPAMPRLRYLVWKKSLLRGRQQRRPFHISIIVKEPVDKTCKKTDGTKQFDSGKCILDTDLYTYTTSGASFTGLSMLSGAFAVVASLIR